MTARATVPKLRSAVLGLVALAWMTHACAVPEDRDARASRWATTDLACASSSAPVPGCGGQRTQVRTASGEELASGYVARAVAAAAAARSASAPPAAPRNRSSQKTSTTLPSAPAKVDDYLPIVHALREAIAALGSRHAGEEILLAFVDRPATAHTDGERLRPLRETSAAFPFVALSPFSTSLSGIYQGEGARFDHVLFHAIDPARLLAWNVFTPESAPESAPERAARVPGGLIPGGPMPGELGTTTALWGIPGVGPERKPGEQKRRTIVYMEKGRTTVMTLEDPVGK